MKVYSAFIFIICVFTGFSVINKPGDLSTGEQNDTATKPNIL